MIALLLHTPARAAPNIARRGAFLLALLLLFFGLLAPAAAQPLSGKRIFYIDSYHAGNPWSDGITRGIEETVAGHDVELKIHRLDTRRNRSEIFKRQAGLQAKAAIEAFAPDVVIVSDDNAVKYVLQRHYRDSDLPFVFCGVNWDAADYGLPYKNTTGMVEVELASELINTLTQYAQGQRIGHIGLNSLSNRKNIAGHERTFGIKYDRVYLVDDFTTWKQRYLALQDESDMVVLGNHDGIVGWNEPEAMSLVRQHTRVPSGTLAPGRMNLALFGYIRIPEEQGQWSAQAALKILAGTPPAEIPQTANKLGVLKINSALRAKLGITISPALFRRAEIVMPYKSRKVFYVSSYLPEVVGWSKGIRDTIMQRLEETGIEYREFFMAAKTDSSPEHAEAQAQEARNLIEQFKPDVVITSDDPAAKYLVAPYYRNTDLPFVFVGVNWDASGYGLPADNVTGMIEIELLEPLLAQLRRYAKGDRIGILSENTLTSEKNIAFHRKLFGVRYDKTYSVDTFEQWKEAYVKLQSEVDILIVRAPFGVRGWNAAEARNFVEEHIKIPTGGLTKDRIPYVMMSYARLPEEQGEWAADAALRILDGEAPGDIELARNKRGELLLNRRLIDKLGITLDRSLYRLGKFVE